MVKIINRSIILFLLTLLISSVAMASRAKFATNSEPIIEFILNTMEMDSIDQLPCISEEQLEAVETALHVDLSSLSGGVCEVGATKAKFGKLAVALKYIAHHMGKNSKYIDMFISFLGEENLSKIPCMTSLQFRAKLAEFGLSSASFGGGLCKADSKVMYYSKFISYAQAVLVDYYEKLTDAKVNLVTYDRLACATKEEFDYFVSELRIDTSLLTGRLCGDDSNKEKIGKLLKYMSTLKVELPFKWRGGADEALRDPIAYLKKNSNGINFDYTSTTAAIAYNSIFTNQISICKLFFTQNPLDAIGTLVHEARHSDAMDPGHAQCMTGDRAHQNGACDDWFDTGKKAGAYAYGVSYYFGLAKYASDKQLSVADREFIRALGISLLSRRFNAVPDMMGLPFETMFVATTQGVLYYLHPITGKKVIVTFPELGEERIKRIEFDRVGTGLRIYVKSGHVFQVKNVYDLIKYSRAARMSTNMIPLDRNVRDITRLTDSKYSTTYYVTEDNVIHQRVFDLDKQIESSVESLLQVPEYEIKELIHGNKTNRYALAKTGELLRFADGKEVVEGERNYVMDDFQAPNEEGWRKVTGGFYYSDLLGVSNDGFLYKQDGDEITKVNLPVPKQREYLKTVPTLLDYQEGSDFNAGLYDHQGGAIILQHYGEERAFRYVLPVNPMNYYHGGEPEKIGSFAVSRRFVPGRRFGLEKEVNPKFIKQCHITKYDIDPWTGKGMGINERDELVFEGINHKLCDVYENHGSIEVTDFRLIGTRVGELGMFSKVAIEIETEGRWRQLVPYDWSNMPR